MDEDTRQHCCPLRIGDAAPSFRARSTTGPIEMTDFAGRWLVFFSHPADFTPVCTSEFVAFAQAAQRFDSLDCALMALSIDSLYAHFAWVRAIRDHYGVEVRFPIVEDPTLVIGRAYGMVSREAGDAGAVRTVFVIDPAQVVRAIVSYPVEIGRSVDEIVRIVTALQAADGGKGLPPEGWQPGDALFAHPEPTLDSVLAAENPVRWFLKEQG
ncbi:peroxiredoxin [Novosphingobium sp. YJ-S2-02]|uniref:Thioredoxin peroxidase n=1 Tax=Novosphingobium aureum TaxID=2792964 RepID=A0A931MN64_9SPHN|nr:peroxiredoxin [Novosphingobium aureum]MBH0115089.1 peroxiredoxin [Novosphingobium aureum]